MLCHAMPHGPHHRTINTADHHDEAMNALAHRHCATSTHTHTHTRCEAASFITFCAARLIICIYIHSPRVGLILIRMCALTLRAYLARRLVVVAAVCTMRAAKRRRHTHKHTHTTAFAPARGVSVIIIAHLRRRRREWAAIYLF